MNRRTFITALTALVTAPASAMGLVKKPDPVAESVEAMMKIARSGLDPLDAIDAYEYLIAMNTTSSPFAVRVEKDDGSYEIWDANDRIPVRPGDKNITLSTTHEQLARPSAHPPE